jgi:hypothetical protein
MGWNQWGPFIFFGVSLCVFFLSAVAAAEYAAGDNFGLALKEYFEGHRRILELLRFARGPLLFGFLSSYACAIFAGIEVKRLGNNYLTIDDAMIDLSGGSEAQLALLGLFIFLFAATLAVICSALISSHFWHDSK